jgi:hypothetical protein
MDGLPAGWEPADRDPWSPTSTQTGAPVPSGWQKVADDPWASSQGPTVNLKAPTAAPGTPDRISYDAPPAPPPPEKSTQLGVGVRALKGSQFEAAGQALSGAAELASPRAMLEPYYDAYARFPSMAPQERAAVRSQIAQSPDLTPGGRQYLQSRLSDVEQGDKPMSRDEFATTLAPQTALGRAGKAVTDYGQSFVTPQERQQYPITSGVASAVGSMAPYVAGGIAAGPVEAVAAGAGMFGLSGAGQQAGSARNAGASEANVHSAATAGGLAGAGFGAADIGAILTPVQRSAPGLVPWVAAKLQQAAQSGVSFATLGEAQEWVGQQIAQNFYDPKAGYSPSVQRILTDLGAGALLGLPTPAGKPAINYNDAARGAPELGAAPPSEPFTPRVPSPTSPEAPPTVNIGTVAAHPPTPAQAPAATSVALDQLGNIAHGQPATAAPPAAAQPQEQQQDQPPPVRSLEQIQDEDRTTLSRSRQIQADELAAHQAWEAAKVAPGSQAGDDLTVTAPAPKGAPHETAAARPSGNGPEVEARPQAVPPQAPVQAAPDTGGIRTSASGGYDTFAPDELNLDPQRFQFKEADERGVTGALTGVKRWSPELADPITAYLDTDGKYYVVNGHQRTDLAKRAQADGQEDIQIPAKVYRAEDGYTPSDMRILGAVQNIAQGSGTSMDAAKIMRELEASKDGLRFDMPELPPRSQLVREARGLTALSGDAFKAVANGVLEPSFAAQIGDILKDPEQQMLAMQLLARNRPANAAQARFMVEDIRNAGFRKAEDGAQGVMFGNPQAESLLPARAAIYEAALKALRGAKRTFNAALQGEETLTAAGNKLATEANTEGKTANEQLIDFIQREARTRGPVSDALTEAAASHAGGKAATGAASDFLARARQLSAGAGANAGEPSLDGRGGEPAPAAGNAAQPARIRSLVQIQTEDKVGPTRAKQIQEAEILARGRVIEPDEGGRIEAEGQGGLMEQPGLAAPRKPLPGVPDMFTGQVSGRPSEAKPTNAAIETVKGQGNQYVMPGMERSAMQAQAARDQAGRGALTKGNQKRADEGLFAAKPPDQALLVQPPRSAHPAVQHGNMAADFNAWVRREGGSGGQPDPYRAAISYVQARGAETGHEYLTMWSPHIDAVVGAHTNHDKKFVSFPDNYKSIEGAGIVVHHNHPSGRSLSSQDLAQLVWEPKFAWVVAHAPDGTYYAARATNDVLNSLRARGTVALGVKRLAGTLWRAARDFILPLYERGQLTQPRTELLHAHAINLAMQRAGMIHYISDVETRMNDREREIVAQIVNDISPPGVDAHDRLSGATSHEQGIARIQSESREAAGVRSDGSGGQGRGPPTDQGAPSVSPQGPGPRRESFGLAEPKDLGLTDPNKAPPRDWITARARELRSWFDPTGLGRGREMEAIIRPHTGMRAQDEARSVDALEKIADVFDLLPVDDTRAFTDRFERGIEQPTPMLQAAAKVLRGELDRATKALLKQGSLKAAKENYFSRAYSNYHDRSDARQGQAPDAAEIAMAQAAGHANILGAGTFRKQRTYEYQSDAIKDGLLPLHENPIRQQLIRLAEMWRWYHGVDLRNDLKRAGLTTYVRPNEESEARAAGLVKLKDPSLEDSHFDDKGNKVVMGSWWAPADAARVFNNYVSRGAAGSSIYRTLRNFNNGLNMMQLSLSAFHATFVTNDLITSQIAQGIMQIARGDLVGGAKHIVIAPAALPRALKRGAELKSWYLHPEAAPEAMRPIVRAFAQAGGRSGLDIRHQATRGGSYIKHAEQFWHLDQVAAHIAKDAKEIWDENPGLWKAWGAVAVPVHIVSRLLETSMQPLMGHLVPLAKMSVWRDAFEDWQARNPDATADDMGRVARDIWDDVEDRLGLVTYENLFWNRGLKDLLFASMRSVGWNTGSLRLMGKTVGGAARLAASPTLGVPKGREAEQIARAMSYTSSMFIMAGIVGGMLTYLFTGERPKELLDYFYPPDGKGGRMSVPGYLKDWVALGHAPLQTLANKQGPLGSLAIQMYNNRDFYGAPMIDSNRPVGSAADTVVNQLLPFSVRGMIKGQQQQLSPGQQAASFLGIQPAPSFIANPQKGIKFQAQSDIRARKAANKEPGRISLGIPW